jgi:hypothetical protein
MEEELLAHLIDVYEEEAGGGTGVGAAPEAAGRRLGDVAELSRQLQASVPLIERVVFTWLGGKDNPMSRFWRILGGIWGVAALVTWAFVFAMREFRVPSMVVLLVGVGLVALCWARPRLSWLVGCLGVLFGTSMILPALAKYAKDHAATGFPLLVLGALIVVGGLGYVAYGMALRRVRTA